MKIKNPNLAGVTLGLKSGPVTGDTDGVFDLPDDEAKRLLDTPGWSAAKKAAPMPEPEPEAEQASFEAEVDAAVDEVTNGDVDLDAMTKADLVSFAQDQGIDIDPYARKDEIREAIEAALEEAG